MKISSTVTIRGRVQRVGYRAWTEREASARKLCGWVKNMDNGEVVAFFEGDRQAVEEMLDKCRRGPFFAKVTEVERQDGDFTGNYRDFRVVSGG